MSDLPTTTLGRTGIEVSKLGYGAMELRFGTTLEPGEAETLLNEVLDSGINFIDTSPDYGDSEELIGQYLSHRRDEFFLASKCGCVAGAIGGEHVFTPENIRAGVEESLRRMKTDHLDLAQFHMSPSRETLESHGSVETLVALQDEGKVRFLGMSGTLPNITDHIAMGVFDEFQIPYSALEREHEQVISNASEGGAGIVVRGGVARGVPTGDAAFAGLPAAMVAANKERYATVRAEIDQRKRRFDEIDFDDLLVDMNRMEFLLRFTISHPHMDTTIVGTKNRAHLRANTEAARKGPLPEDVYQEAKRRLG